MDHRAPSRIGLVTAALVAAALAGCMTIDQLVLRPSPAIRYTPTELGYEFESLMLPRPDGGWVGAWRVPARGEHKGTLVFVPGNDANRGRFTVVLPIFVDRGWDVILYDFQGFGDSSGTPTFQGLIDSSRVVFAYATARDRRVVGFGASLGAPVLIRIAAEFDLAAVILESTANLRRQASLFFETLGVLPDGSSLLDPISALVVPDDFDSVRWVREVTEPKLFVHSPDDTLTPFAAAWEIYRAAPAPKHFFLTQYNHAIEPLVDPDLYAKLVNAWLDGVLGFDPIDNPRLHELLQENLQVAIDWGLHTPP